MPLFKGNYETRLRLKVIYRKRKGDKEYNLYSNEIKISINPAQFWRRSNYKLRTIEEEDDAIN